MCCRFLCQYFSSYPPPWLKVKVIFQATLLRMLTVVSWTYGCNHVPFFVRVSLDKSKAEEGFQQPPLLPTWHCPYKAWTLGGTVNTAVHPQSKLWGEQSLPDLRYWLQVHKVQTRTPDSTKHRPGALFKVTSYNTCLVSSFCWSWNSTKTVWGVSLMTIESKPWITNNGVSRQWLGPAFDLETYNWDFSLCFKPGLNSRLPH